MIKHFKAAEHRFLSNMWPCKVFLDDLEYKSVEHAYVAAKTADLQIREQIRNMDNPREVKKFGKTIVVRENWDNIKLNIMKGLIAQKFSIAINPSIASWLDSTGDEHIQEGNWWCDYFWGVSIREDKTKGRGENNLGKLIMEVRTKNREEAAAAAVEGL